MTITKFEQAKAVYDKLTAVQAYIVQAEQQGLKFFDLSSAFPKDNQGLMDEAAIILEEAEASMLSSLASMKALLESEFESL